MLDLVALQVCSLLRLPDLQALGQTSRPLRKLVHEQLPPGTWSDVVKNTLPAGHPALLFSDSQIRAYPARLQRAKQTLPIPVELGVF